MLPDEMPLSNQQIRGEIKNYAYTTIRKSESANGSIIAYNGVSQYGIDSVQVGLSGRNVRTVFPVRGQKVRKWNGNEWQRWPESNSWGMWNDYQP